MSITLQDIQKLAVKKVPEIKIGSTVRVHQRIKEGEKERVQIFEGLVIAINSGHGADKTFTVRKLVEGIGVEKVFPLYSPMIKKIEVKKESKIRRAKLYYMRTRSGKSARMKETLVSSKGVVDEEEEQKAATAKEKSEATEKPEVAQDTTQSTESAGAPAETEKEKTTEADSAQAEENQPAAEEKAQTKDAPAVETPSAEASTEEEKKEPGEETK